MMGFRYYLLVELMPVPKFDTAAFFGAANLPEVPNNLDKLPVFFAVLDPSKAEPRWLILSQWDEPAVLAAASLPEFSCCLARSDRVLSVCFRGLPSWV